MKHVQTVYSILFRQTKFTTLLLIFVGILSLLFIILERLFILNVVVGDFPLELFIAILPSMLLNFLFGEGVLMLTHYLFISFLLTTYLVLLTHIFIRMRYLSFSSMTVGIAGLFGITLGVTCLSCGALAGVVLISALGAFTSSSTLLSSSSTFLIIGEMLLILSIVLVTFTINRFSGVAKVTR